MRCTSWIGLALISATASAGPIGPLRYAEDRAPGIANPLFATSMAEARLNELMFEGLFTDDAELRSAPELAASFTLAPDKRSMEIALRQGVTWHDGTSLTAKDVVFTVEAMKNPATASTEASRVAFIQKATAIGPTTLRLQFVGEEWTPEDKLHFKILPAHKFASNAVKRTDDFRSQPIGTGPFRLLSFNSDNSISLKRADGNMAATLIEIQMREVADKNYQAKLLLYESLEALVRVLPRDLPALQNDRKVALYPYQTNSWWYVGYNLKNTTLSSTPVRQALHKLVDVQSLLDPIGTGEVLSGPFVKSSPFYNHDIKVGSVDPEGAKALLQTAGYQFVGRQWMKDGQPLRLRIAAPDNLETAQDVVINIQSQFQSQGIIVEPEFLGSTDWKQRVWKDHDYDLVLSQWSFDRNEDIYEQFHSKGMRNFGSYSNPKVDTLLEQARRTTDPQQKRALLRQVHGIVAEDKPMIFLWTLDSYSAISTKVKNVVVHPFYFFTWIQNWMLKGQ